MAGFSYGTNVHLVRSNLWSSELKEVLLDDLNAMQYVRMITDFPDGDTLNIPSISQAEVLDYAEGQGVKYTAMDTGNFTFTINKYKQSATYITERYKQDSYYTNQLVSSFVPKMHRAIMAQIENDIMAIGPDGQTASNLNAINGANHRWIGSGTSEVMALKDFQLANYALNKANVPHTNRVAIVDDSVEYQLSTLANLTNVSNNPRWEGIVRDGMSTGMKFFMNIYGFDVYISHYLKNSISETINSVTATTGVANLFFSTEGDVVPFVGLLRQPPKVDSEYNKDYQREEYVTTCRYGFKLYRPENMVVVITDTDQVS